MINKKLTELIRDANREITPADRHSILDLIEQQAARITELETKCRLYEASLDKADKEADGLRAARVAYSRPSSIGARLSDAAIEAGWLQTFSISNPFCPCDLKSFTKAVRWAEYAIAKEAK